MAVDFSFQGLVDVVGWSFFGGDASVAGLVILCAVLFISVAFFAAVKAPVSYALVPAMLVTIVFTSFGILDTTISFVIIILSAVLIAAQAKGLTGGR